MNVVSLSGGKDSTCMLLMMLERNVPVDEVAFFDTGWEFPQMYEHLDKLEAYTGVEITRLKPDIPFTELMLHNHRTRGKRKDITAGYGWANMMGRWCTTYKNNVIGKHIPKDADVYVGIAADETNRVKDKHYPLVDWGITEKMALDYCLSHGFNWGGLYDHFKRVSCYCCPLQSLQDLRSLRRFYPELWCKTMELDIYVNHSVDAVQSSFRKDYSLPQLELKFRDEDKQARLAL